MQTQTLPTWDLSEFYTGANDPAITQDIERIRDRSKRFSRLFKGTVSELEAEIFGSAIFSYEEIQDALGRISSYSYLLFAEDMTTEAHSQLYQNVSEAISEISSELLFFEMEICTMSALTLEKKLTHPQVQRYSAWIRDVREMSNHLLSPESEQILHEKTITSKQSWHRLFEETMAHLRFSFKGKNLTSSEIFNYLSSHDASERKTAAKSIAKTLKDHSRTFVFITNILAKEKAIDDKWRRFATPLSARNLDNLVEDDVTQSLIRTVKANYPNLAHRYYRLKAQWMGQKRLNYWDRNAPLPDAQETLIPWDDAQELVLSAYREFSPEMADIAQRFFDEGWIHAAPAAGKDSGAFSHPTVPSAHPYILLNYHGKTRDVMTLAHELGHGVHQVLSAKQGALLADTPLTLAETASVFGEQLTFRKLLTREKDPAIRKIHIANKVEDMLNTVVRQIAFCDFELHVHTKRRDHELSEQEIGDIWMHVQAESLGPSVELKPEYRHYWSYIPHFIHTPFYVYAYAFGDCLVNSLYQHYLDQPKGFETKYLNLLKAGGSLRHKELLEPFNLDATQPDFWQEGLNMVAHYIDALESNQF